MSFRRVIISSVLLIGVVQILFAAWVGKGEIEGEVRDARDDNERVVFLLDITSQKVDSAQLGSGNWFSYAGIDRLEISKGDIVRLKVNRSDPYGIHVEQITFIENKPGNPDKSFSFWWYLLLVIPIAALSVFFLLGTIKRKVKVLE